MFSLIGAYFQTIHPLSHPPKPTGTWSMWHFWGPLEPQTPGILRRFKHALPDLSVIVSQPMPEPWTEVCFWWTGQWQSPALHFRVPPAVAVREAKSANSREPDAECATVCQFLQHWGEIALNTSQDTYMLPHSGHMLQQQRRSSHLTWMWPPTSVECICMICL